jgi:transposase
MKPSQLERKLIAAAKAQAPSDAVPYAFEQRIMARLGKVPAIDLWADWSRALWRAAAPCVAIAIGFGVWHAYVNHTNNAAPDLSQDLERTVLASVALDTETLQ